MPHVFPAIEVNKLNQLNEARWDTFGSTWLKNTRRLVVSSRQRNFSVRLTVPNVNRRPEQYFHWSGIFKKRLHNDSQPVCKLIRWTSFTNLYSLEDEIGTAYAKQFYRSTQVTLHWINYNINFSIIIIIPTKFKKLNNLESIFISGARAYKMNSLISQRIGRDMQIASLQYTYRSIVVCYDLVTYNYCYIKSARFQQRS